MKGIIEENGKVFCANCKKTVEINQNFCINCGSPLTSFAIEKENENKKEIERNVIRNINSLAKENPNLNSKELINLYIENIE